MRKVYLLCFVAVLFVACSSNNKKRVVRTDTPTSGTARMACDECFAPIIKEELEVFDSMNPNAMVNPIYTNEQDAIKMLLTDSVRLVVAARELTAPESQMIENLGLKLRSHKIATDGIALIINKVNNDSLMSMSTLKKIMTGEITSWKEIDPKSVYDKITVVFDNPKSSTVRFVKDSICGDKDFGKNLTSLQTNRAVMDYVSKSPGSLGVIGVNWVSNPNDSTNLSFINGIKVMALSRSENPTLDNSYKPIPAFLALGDYPLTREMYMIITDLAGTLPTGIVNFTSGDRGQRIILKAGLLPATRPVRLVSIQNNF